MPTSILVMPKSPAAWGGAAALWVTVAGWSGALRRRGVGSVIVTPGGMLTEDECVAATASTAAAGSGQPRFAKVPLVVRQGVRDVQRIHEMRSWSKRVVAVSATAGTDVGPFVWQHHELFHRAGERLASRFDRPLIEYVHAPVVWEARRWGVARRGTGAVLERLGEQPQLRRADLVACVTAEVATRVEAFGVDPARIIVSPMGVDPERFTSTVDGSEYRRLWGELGDFVFGWVGSFRRFHAIEVAIEALAELRARGLRAGLVLGGSGQDRPRLETIVAERGLSAWVRFTGQVANSDVPRLLASFDATVITAAAGQDFHYSPLKLREYMAMSLPTVGPDVGELGRLAGAGGPVEVYSPGDAVGLADALARLADDPVRRHELGARARAHVIQTGTWDVMVADAIDALRAR